MAKNSFLSLCASTLLLSSVFATNAFSVPDEDEDSHLEKGGGDLSTSDKKAVSLKSSSINGKGYRDNEKLFNYIPFTTLVNVGFGSYIDIRGQGAMAKNKVKMLVNGATTNNILDTFGGLSVMNTVVPGIVEEIEILPGGNSVLYGAGAKGGVINIKTFTRSEVPVFSAGVGYSYMSATSSPAYNADVQFRDKLGNVYVNIGLAYMDKKGPRKKEEVTGYEVSLGLLGYITDRQSLNLNLDYFSGEAKLGGFDSFARVGANEPTKENREGFYETGYDPQRFTQSRITTRLGYSFEPSDNTKFALEGFYHTNIMNFDPAQASWGPRVLGNILFPNILNIATDSLDDKKYGFSTSFDYTHSFGTLLLGYQNSVQNSTRVMDRTIWGRNGRPLQAGLSTVFNLDYILNNQLQAKISTSAFYASEKINLTDNFSFSLGGRYEIQKDELKIKDINKYTRSDPANPNGTKFFGNFNNPAQLEDTVKNFAASAGLDYKYSSTGFVYGKYERGYDITPLMYKLKRNISNIRQQPQQFNQNILADISWDKQEFNKENFHDFELGLKDDINENFSVFTNLFFTKTNNEFYALSNYNPAILIMPGQAGGQPQRLFPEQIVGSWDKTRRYGVELAFRQGFGGVSAYESFTYLKSEKFENEKWEQIPYTYDYKATLGLSAEIGAGFSLWTQAAFFGAQKALMMSNSSNYGDKKLDPYTLVDLGISWQFNEGLGAVNVGVRNVADTFYYDYYSKDRRTRADTIVGNGYIIGQGRTFFIEGRFTY